MRSRRWRVAESAPFGPAALAATVGLLLVPGTAAAAVTCTYTPATGALDVAVTNGTTLVNVSRAATPSTDVLVDTDSNPSNGTIACGGGTPTLANTAIITVDEAGSAQSTTMALDFSRGRLEPGLGAEADPEIEAAFVGDASEDVLFIDEDTAVGDRDYRFGAVGSTVTGANLNFDADDAADDLTLSGITDISVLPGSGDDGIYLDGSGDPAFTGPASQEFLVFASNGGELVRAGTGRGSVSGGPGADTFIGGPGNDSFEMAEGDDTYDGAGGSSDFISYENFASVQGVTLDMGLTSRQNTVGFGLDQAANAENIVGTNGPDEITGTGGPNILFGGNGANDTGADVLDGAGGADFLRARKGDDLLIGGQGNDLLEGDDGFDMASYRLGSTGPVSLSLNLALTGSAQATGGAGTDTLVDTPLDAGTEHDIEGIVGGPFAGDSLTGNGLANRIDLHDGLADTADCVASGDGDVVLTDEAGVDSVTLCETQDLTPQTAIVSGPPSGALIASKTTAYSLTATEPSSFELSVDGGPFAPCPATCSPPALGDGAHTLAFRAVDTDENLLADLTPATRTLVIDTTPPVTTIRGQAKFKTKKKSAKVKFTLGASEAGAGFECSLDGAPFAACSSPFTAKAKRGKHTLRVRASDAAGNVDDTPAARAFKVTKKK